MCTGLESDILFLSPKYRLASKSLSKTIQQSFAMVLLFILQAHWISVSALQSTTVQVLSSLLLKQLQNQPQFKQEGEIKQFASEVLEIKIQFFGQLIQVSIPLDISEASFARHHTIRRLLYIPFSSSHREKLLKI